jgi:hypothetical protein
MIDKTASIIETTSDRCENKGIGFMGFPFSASQAYSLASLTVFDMLRVAWLWCTAVHRGDLIIANSQGRAKVLRCGCEAPLLRA